MLSEVNIQSPCFPLLLYFPILTNLVASYVMVSWIPGKRTHICTIGSFILDHLGMYYLMPWISFGEVLRDSELLLITDKSHQTTSW
jgi:hypothetical protein